MITALGVLAEFVFGDNAALLDVAGKRRIRHDNIEVEAAVIVFDGAELAQFFPAFVVNIFPGVVVDNFVPASVVQGV